MKAYRPGNINSRLVTEKKRAMPVSAGLLALFLIAPIIFIWPLLCRGYSTQVKCLSLLWFLVSFFYQVLPIATMLNSDDLKVLLALIK